MLSTSSKIAFGYILLIGLLIGSIWYIYQQMELLSARTETESLINDRRQTTHKIISKLYEIEIIGQTLHSGRASEYRSFNRKMKEVQLAIDTLQAQLTDSLQCQRLDTLRTLLKYKNNNVRAVTKALQRTPTDQIYQQQFDSLLTQQDSLLNSTHVRRRVITHHNTYTIHNKPKGFFKRIANVFAPGKEDSVEVSNVIQEEFVDTLEEAYNPIDTIASMLTDIHSKVLETRQQEVRTLDAHVRRLRMTGSDLSRRVNQLLETIEREEQEAAQRKMLQEREIRNHAAWTMATISIIAVVLVLVFFTIIWHDLTKSNHYRRELEKAKLYAENLLMAREKLMLTITHDIKAPAGSIIGYLDLLNRLVKDKRQLFYLNNMHSAAQHLLNLVTSLLDFHRLEAGKMDLNPVSFKPTQLLEDIYHCFLPLADKKQIELNLHLDMKANLTLEGDPFRLRQIVENLLSNALKFTAQGSIILQSTYQGNQFIIRISDTGCGMTKEEQSRIFKEFTRLHSAQGQEGFGLGLSITRKLIDLQHGKIRVDSIPRVGSSFEVSIPLPSFGEKSGQSSDNQRDDYKVNNTEISSGDHNENSTSINYDRTKNGNTNSQDANNASSDNEPSNNEASCNASSDNELSNNGSGYNASSSNGLSNNEASSNRSSSNEPSNNGSNICSTKALRLLVIDDDKIQLQLTEALLHRVFETSTAPVEIRCCEQPEEVLDNLNDVNKRYDLLFTDIQMPAMNGFELLEAIRNLPNGRGNHLAVVAITARGDMDEEGFKEKGFAGMLQKPFNLSDLRRILLGVLPNKIQPTAILTEQPIGQYNSQANKVTREKTGTTRDESGTTRDESEVTTKISEHTELFEASEQHEAPNSSQAGYSFNFESLLAFTDGDTEAAQEILTTFIQETKKHISLIEQAVSLHDYQRLCEIGHKMLPTFTMIEAGEAVGALQWLDSKRGATFDESLGTQTLANEALEKATIVTQYARAVVEEVTKRCINK